MMQQGPLSTSVHLLKRCSNAPNSKSSRFPFCPKQSRRADMDTLQCFASEVAGCWLQEDTLYYYYYFHYSRILILALCYFWAEEFWIAEDIAFTLSMWKVAMRATSRWVREQINVLPEALVLRHLPHPIPQPLTREELRHSANIEKSLRYTLVSCIGPRRAHVLYLHWKGHLWQAYSQST